MCTKIECKIIQTAKHEIIQFERRPIQDSNCFNNYFIITGKLGPAGRPRLKVLFIRGLVIVFFSGNLATNTGSTCEFLIYQQKLEPFFLLLILCIIYTDLQVCWHLTTETEHLTPDIWHLIHMWGWTLS